MTDNKFYEEWMQLDVLAEDSCEREKIRRMGEVNQRIMTKLLEHGATAAEMSEELVEKVSTEDKIIFSREEALGLEPYEISEIVQEALGRFGDVLAAEDVDLGFDIIYDAISEALNKRAS